MADTMAGSSPEPAPTPKTKGTPKSKGKPKAAAKNPTKTPTKSKDTVELTPRELELLVGALTNLKDDAKLQVNYEGMAGATGLKDGKSAKASWASLRKKLNLPGLTSGGGGSTPAATTPAISPEKPVGVTKTPKKGKAPVKAKKIGKLEETKDESKEENAAAAAADDDASELPDVSSAGSVADHDDDKVVAEDPKEEATVVAVKNDDSD